MDASNAKRDELLETLQQSLATLAEDRDASAERTQGIVARFFKVAIAIVCLNVVIAGANIAMILFRTESAPAAPVPPPVAALPQAPAPTEPQVPAAEDHLSDETASPKPQSTVPPAPEKPATPPATERRIPLLGAPSSTKAVSPVRTAAILAVRPAHSVARAVVTKPYLAAEENADDLALARPERW
jgi:hypothetical protein